MCIRDSPIILGAYYFGWGLAGIWVGQLAQVLARLVGVVARFRSMKWASERNVA